MATGVSPYTGPAPSDAARTAALRGQGNFGQSSTGGLGLDPSSIIAGVDMSAASDSATVTVRRPTAANGTPWSISKAQPVSTPLGQYVQEFSDRWEGDLPFQSWVMSRMIAAGMVNPKSATVADYMNAWESVGKAASVEKGAWNGTPEQYLEFAASGQKMTPSEIEQAIRDGLPIIDPATGLPVGPETAAVVNPITTHRSTSSATINREAAYAAADQMSQQLLGRMASKGEMAKARAIMNRMLAANPTVTTSTTDATDPNNVTTSSHTTDGMSAGDAQAAVQMKMQRSSEGTAYGVGNMFEDAMSLMASREG